MLNSPLIRPIDNARVLRLALAWATDDNAAFLVALAEVQQDEAPNAASAALFAAINIAVEALLSHQPDDYVGTLQAAILKMVVDAEPDDRG